MKNNSNAHPRAIALLLAAVALPITPALAQEASAPPPVAETVAPTPAAPVPEVTMAPAVQSPVFAPRQEVVQPLPPRPAPPVAAEETASPAPLARSTPVRRGVTPTATRAPVAEAVQSPTPVVAEPVAQPAPTAPEVVTTPAAADATSPDATMITETTTTTASTPWMWIGLGIVALAAIALALLRGRKRRDEDVYYDEPTIAAAPVVAAPVVEPVMTTAPIQTAPVVTTPVSQPAKRTEVADEERPWIGLSVWPKEATGGTVQYDLVVENVSDVEAHDVRVSSLIIDGTKSTPMESALIEDAETRSIDIGAGHSIPIAQTIEVVEGTSPHILAEARYPLPGGGEGHIAARFALDTAKDGTIEARLDDLLERV